MLTNGAELYSQKLANFHFWAHLLGGIGMGASLPSHCGKSKGHLRAKRGPHLSDLGVSILN
jgi:hypothetical protein